MLLYKYLSLCNKLAYEGGGVKIGKILPTYTLGQPKSDSLSTMHSTKRVRIGLSQSVVYVCPVTVCLVLFDDVVYKNSAQLQICLVTIKTTNQLRQERVFNKKSCKSARDVRLVVLFLKEGSKNTLQSAILALKIRLNGQLSKQKISFSTKNWHNYCTIAFLSISLQNS